jgi:hypothetical protein
MFEPHEGSVKLQFGFEAVHRWLSAKGETALITAAGAHFTARGTVATRGSHAGDPVIRFFQSGAEYGRAYRCCWGHYYNCNRARIGMYCKALDSKVENPASGSAWPGRR